MKNKTTLGINLFEKSKYRAILQGGLWPFKNYDMIFDLIEFSQRFPNENTLFVGNGIISNIETVMNFLNLKWYIYIEMDYEMLTRGSFVGKFKVVTYSSNAIKSEWQDLQRKDKRYLIR